MTDKPDPDKLKGPGGMTMRELHEQVKRSAERDRKFGKIRNRLGEPQSRWQRFMRYVWDKKKG